jgi:serine protein kinase
MRRAERVEARMAQSSLADLYRQRFEGRRETEMSLAAYLDGCREDPTMYAPAAERMLAVIGEAQTIDTAKDPRCCHTARCPGCPRPG